MKLFVTDYDNTLYTTDDEMIETIKEINRIRNKGVIFVIATGRGITSIQKEIIKHNIPFDYISCADGSVIYDNNYNIVKEFLMDNDILDELSNLLKNTIYEDIQYSYNDGYHDTLDLTKPLNSINLAILENCFTKETQDKWYNLKNKYPNYNYLTYKHVYPKNNSYIYYLCIKNKDISKSKSIEYLANYLNINDNDIYVIGDSDNDYEMIKDYNGSCVSNATDNIKNVSKCVYEKISDYLNLL